MTSLDEIATKYKTDKCSAHHDYVALYEELFGGFKDESFKLLEIGIWQFGSLWMWRDWFPNATIYGIDNKSKYFYRLEKHGSERLVVDVVDQADTNKLRAYAEEKGPWRIIVDDGGHLTIQQNTAFDVLWDHVEPGGYYVCEDTHTSCALFKEGKYINDKETFVEKMMNLASELSMLHAPGWKCYDNNYLHRREHEDLSKWQHEIKSITFHMGIIVIKKRENI